MRKLLLALIAVSAAWTLLVAVTGGIDLRPFQIRFKSTEADRPAYVFLALTALYAVLFRGHVRGHIGWLESRATTAAALLERRASLVVLAAAVLTFTAGMVYGIHVAGGSDSYGYLSQARLWLAGDLIVDQPIATAVPWPDADATFAPLAYRPAQRAGAIVPVYAPGLPVLMALGQLSIGRCGAYVVVPLLAAWLVWTTFRLGALIWSPLVGLASSLLVATSPVFLFMTMNPMSDVAVTAFFTAGLVLALSRWHSRAFWTGVVVSLGIFVRPNLVPIAVLYLGCLLVRAEAGQRWRTFWWFACGGAPPVLAVAATNASLYGAPWRAGYGSLEGFYAWGYLWRNVQQYTGWMFRIETPVIFLGAAAIGMFWRSGDDRRISVRFAGLFVAVVWLSYLFYAPFDVWLYLRFFLPAIPAMFVLAAVAAAALLARVAGPQRVAAIGLLLAIPFLAFRIERVRELGVLNARIGGVVFLSAAEYVRTRLPENAVILTVNHSGSIRYYTNRLTLRWDLLGADWWPRALDVLVERGYRPYLLVSSYEEAQLRTQFGLSDAADAPGALVAQMTTPESIRIYDPLRRRVEAPDTIPAVPVCPCGLEVADPAIARR